MSYLRFAVCILALSLLSVLGAPEALAQSSALKSAIVRVSSGDAGKIPGTGVIVNLDGKAAYILTASHVIKGKTRAQVEFFTQRKRWFSARVIDAQDGERGLALLLVDAPLPDGLSNVSIDENVKLEGGERITVIGHPATGGAWSVSSGVLNAEEDGVLYFSVPIDPGNSGGPLLIENRVVGLVTHKGPTFGEAVGASRTLPLLGRIFVDKPLSQRKVGEVFRDCLHCPDMVVVPAGYFLMGSLRDREERPQHRVEIRRSLAIGRTEVTRGQFARFIDETGHKTDSGCYTLNSSQSDWLNVKQKSWHDPGFAQTDEHPVVCINWDDAAAYAEWLAKKTSKNYRLLSEAEWEYAARAGTLGARYWGETFDPQGCKHANIADATAEKSLNLARWNFAACDDGQVFTARVASYKANAFGLHDMLGNTFEWTQDCWNDSYEGAPARGEAWTRGNCGLRVLRGGSWAAEPVNARATLRLWVSSLHRLNSFTGLRVARAD